MKSHAPWNTQSLHTSMASAFPMLLGLAIVLAASARTASSEKLDEDQKERVKEAIAILKAYDDCCSPELPDGMKAGTKIAACLETILANGNICAGGVGDGAKGRKTLDDTSSNCGDQDIIKASKKVVDTDKLSHSFVDLMMILYHEAVHALQDLSEFETSDYEDKHTAALELQAWTAQLRFLRKFLEAMNKLVENRENGEKDPQAGMDECQKKLTDCFKDEERVNRLKRLTKKAQKLIDLSEDTIEDLEDAAEQPCPDDEAPETGKPREETEEADDDVEDDDGPKIASSGPGSGDVRTVEDDIDFEILESILPTGLSEVFGLAWQRDKGALDHLVVCGHRDGRGIVQVWADETPGVADGLSLELELDVDPVTSAPSGLEPFGPDGSGGLLVWDERQSQLYALVDGDSDGVVDTLDPTPRNLLDLPTDDLTRLDLDDRDEATGALQYTLSRVALGCLTGRLPWVVVVDLDQDGFFETSDFAFRGVPHDDPRRGPAYGSRPMAGVDRVVATGVRGHDLQLFEVAVDGTVIGPLSDVATVGLDHEVVLTVPGGPPLGALVQVFDLTNEATSIVRTVEPARPEADRAFLPRSPGIGGVDVFQRGHGLDSLEIVDVLVGGVSAPAFEASSEGLVYTTPPNDPVPGDGVTDESLLVPVVIRYEEDGVTRELPAQELAYVDPLLTPDYACRRGNVGGATGIVNDVVLVNGYAGRGNSRLYVIDPLERFELEMLAPPSRPAGPSKFVFYAWLGEPAEGTVTPLPRSTGLSCRLTPIDGGVPKKTANNLGKPALGEENWPGPPTTPAPTILLSSDGGLGFEGVFTLQGIVLDSDAPNGLAAVTNAIVVESRAD